MTTPAVLLRAAAAVLPTAAPTTTKSAWSVASEAGLRRVRPLGPRQENLSAREIASLLIARLAGDTKPEMRAYAGRLGHLRSISPVIAAPAHWRQTATLGADHSFLDLVEALTADALHGQMEGDRERLELVELRFLLPEFTAEIRASGVADSFGAGYRAGSTARQTPPHAIGTARTLDLMSVRHLAEKIRDGDEQNGSSCADYERIGAA